MPLEDLDVARETNQTKGLGMLQTKGNTVSASATFSRQIEKSAVIALSWLYPTTSTSYLQESVSFATGEVHEDRLREKYSFQTSEHLTRCVIIQ